MSGQEISIFNLQKKV